MIYEKLATSSTAMKSPRAAAPVHGFGKVASRSRPQENVKAVEEEYIKNLQQQIYLLELETRFLRQNKSEFILSDATFSSASSSNF